MGDHPKAVQYEDNRGITFQIKLQVIADGGEVSVSGDQQLTIRGARSVNFPVKRGDKLREI